MTVALQTSSVGGLGEVASVVVPWDTVPATNLVPLGVDAFNQQGNANPTMLIGRATVAQNVVTEWPAGFDLHFSVDPGSSARINQADQGAEFTLGLDPPPAAPTVARQTAAGNIDAGTHYYKLAYVSSNKETVTYSYSALVTTDATHAQVAVTLPLGSSYCSKRVIYRTKAGADPTLATSWYLVATINNNTATSYTDNIADSALRNTRPVTVDVLVSSDPAHDVSDSNDFHGDTGFIIDIPISGGLLDDGSRVCPLQVGDVVTLSFEARVKSNTSIAGHPVGWLRTCIYSFENPGGGVAGGEALANRGIGFEDRLNEFTKTGVGTAAAGTNRTQPSAWGNRYSVTAVIQAADHGKDLQALRCTVRGCLVVPAARTPSDPLIVCVFQFRNLQIEKAAAPTTWVHPTTKAGNTLVAAISSRYTTAPVFTLPAGWVAVAGGVIHNTDGVSSALYYYPNAPAQDNFSLTLDTARVTAVSLVELPGVQPAGSLDGTAQAQGTTATLSSGTTPAIAADAEIAVGLHATQSPAIGANPSPPGWELLASAFGLKASDPGNSLEAISHGLYAKTDTVAGSTQGVAATIPNPRHWIGEIATFRTSPVTMIGGVGIPSVADFGVGFVDSPPPVVPPIDDGYYFCPPITTTRVPPWARIPQAPPSIRYRALAFQTNYGPGDTLGPEGSPGSEGGLEIGGAFYPGGRWSGPLSSAAIAALQAAGFATQIVHITPGHLEQLPARPPS